MKRTINALVFCVLSTALGVAQAQQAYGSWHVYSGGGNFALIQTTSLTGNESTGIEQGAAKLDVICRKGEVAGLAMTVGAPVMKEAVDFKTAAETVQIRYSGVQLKAEKTGSWAVLDGGRTLTPYSEMFQTKLNRGWIENLVVGRQVTFEIPLGDYSGSENIVFDPAGLAGALASVGCSY